jgi:hypothetical protein
MLAWRKTPTQHGVEAAGGFAGFSLLTEGDVLRKVVGQDAASLSCRNTVRYNFLLGIIMRRASVTIIAIGFAWILQTIVAAVPTAPVVFFARRRVHWNAWELLAFVLPFLVWTLLMFSDLSTGRKSLSNLIEPAILGIAICIAAIVRASSGSRFPESRLAWALIVGLCIIAAGIFFLVPFLPE